jgi:hypothetical protein
VEREGWIARRRNAHADFIGRWKRADNRNVGEGVVAGIEDVLELVGGGPLDRRAPQPEIAVDVSCCVAKKRSTAARNFGSSVP